MSSYYTSSFIDIIHYLSDSLVQCDASTKIAELFGEEFDDIDFEMAMCCFEATHRLSFKQELVNIPIDQYENFSLEEFLEAYLDLAEQKDPLFVAQRFRMFEDALTRAIAEEQTDSEDF
jgi:hypothetical protein